MKQRIWRYRKVFLIHACIFFSITSFAQCPPNIGFETGTFQNWECSIGLISAADGSIQLDPTSPVSNRHTIIQNSAMAAKDIYGGFPTNCPNGSGYSIQLGNSLTQRQTERVSYTFTIPADDNNYSIIYNYAVVFQNPAGHASWEQPQFTANVFDVSSGGYIDCSSFAYTASSNLPGFFLSTVGDKVYCKPWTPVTIKLSGYAGRTIRLEFTTNDCSKGGHFGYAYIDVNQNCSSPISGNTHCFNDTAQILTGPYGFAGYRWFNGNNLTKVLDTTQTLNIKPLPAQGTVFAVEITPFPGQGCIDTVYTSIVYSSETIELKTPSQEIVSCVSYPIDLTSTLITAGSSPGLDLSYFSEPSLINYLPTPSSITTGGVYYIKAINSIGCTVMKPVTVRIATFPVFNVGKPPYVRRPNVLDLSTVISGDQSGIVFTYWKDSLATKPINNPKAIDRTGRYFIKATIEGGCYKIFGMDIVIDEALISPPNAFTPNGDGVHDEWEIPLLASLYFDCIVDIYNRLGQQIFHSVGYSKPWDGKYKGLDQPVATYYYVIKARSDLAPVSGSVTIVR
ncbi:MAG: gliding motility-associated C-terminal domain-containing protein [Bacteroidota bacterium]